MTAWQQRAPTARTPLPDPGDDDTVRIVPPKRPQPPAPPATAIGVQKPPLLTSRRAWLAGAGILGAACLLRGISSLVLAPRQTPAPALPVTARAPIPPSPFAGPEFAIQSADERTILHNVSTGLSVFRFAPDQRILVLDFASLYEQGLMLDRVAALIEKARTPHDRVLNDADLLQAISASGSTVATYYYGHDYSAASLQRFFTFADAERIPLYPEEDRLRRLLRQVGWFEPGMRAGLISIPAIGANEYLTLPARSAILHHELSHGLFFSDPDYADFVHDFWAMALTQDEREQVRGFLGSEGYDTSYEELMYNEMQAYLMFTRDPEFFAPAMVGMTRARLADLQNQFLRGMPTGWLREALAATPVVISETPEQQERPRGRRPRLHAG